MRSPEPPEDSDMPPRVSVPPGQSSGWCFGVHPVEDVQRERQSRSVDPRRDPMRLQLEVQFEGQPICGRLYDRGGEGSLSRPFTGWLGLLAAIEAVREADASTVPDERKEGRS